MFVVGTINDVCFAGIHSLAALLYTVGPHWSCVSSASNSAIPPASPLSVSPANISSQSNARVVRIPFTPLEAILYGGSAGQKKECTGDGVLSMSVYSERISLLNRVHSLVLQELLVNDSEKLKTMVDVLALTASSPDAIGDEVKVLSLKNSILRILTLLSGLHSGAGASDLAPIKQMLSSFVYSYRNQASAPEQNYSMINALINTVSCRHHDLLAKADDIDTENCGNVVGSSHGLGITCLLHLFQHRLSSSEPCNSQDMSSIIDSVVAICSCLSATQDIRVSSAGFQFLAFLLNLCVQSVVTESEHSEGVAYKRKWSAVFSSKDAHILIHCIVTNSVNNEKVCDSMTSLLCYVSASIPPVPPTAPPAGSHKGMKEQVQSSKADPATWLLGMLLTHPCYIYVIYDIV